MTTVARGLETASEEAIGESNTKKLFGASTVKQLEGIEKILSDADIQLSKAQEKNFEKSLALKSSEAIGAFGIMAGKFAIYDIATAGIFAFAGFPRFLAALKNSKSTWDKIRFQPV